MPKVSGYLGSKAPTLTVESNCSRSGLAIVLLNDVLTTVSSFTSTEILIFGNK